MTIKLLLDSCVWGGASAMLTEWGYDTVYVGDWEYDPGDLEIIKQAHAQERVLVTLDKDFGELAIVRGEPHAGIIRLVNFSARKQAEVCKTILEQYTDDLLDAAIITVEPDRIRIRSNR